MHTLPLSVTEFIETFAEISDTREKFEFLIELSEDLEPFPESKKTKENIILGCASNAWITVEKKNDRNASIKFSGTGDAVISKGMLSFFIQCFEGLSATEILKMKDVFLERFLTSGVISSLSPSRVNGAKAMLEKIYNECEKITKISE